MANLALFGGKKVRIHNFPPYTAVGNEERMAVQRVFDSQIFSRFLGCWHENFYGGPEVKALEKEWAAFFKVKHAIAVNSATSALFCAVGACNIGPGDEVIVSPYTMTASALAPLIYNAIPVFADVEEHYFCLDPNSVKKNLTKHTKAIIVVDLFGQPYDADRINRVAKERNLYVIEDCSQAPGAMYNGKFAGTLGDIGIYSLNYHKHIHTGEGGIIVTENDELAERMRLIRNHAEAVVESKGNVSLINMLGFNYRMTEIEAAMAREQLKKLPDLIAERLKNVRYLADKLSKIPCLEVAKERENSKHVYYLQAIKFHQETAGVHRNDFVRAVQAELMPIQLRENEGVNVSSGYVKPLYLLPLYQQKIAYGSRGCPFTCEKYTGKVSYQKGICPTVEHLHESVLITHELMRPGMLQKDLDDVVSAFHKVWEYRSELKLNATVVAQ